MGDRQLIAVLWRRRWVLVACVGLGLALALAVTALQARTYEASALLRVAAPGDAEASGTGRELATNYAALLTTPGFLRRIEPRVAGGGIGADELRRALAVEPLESTTLLRVSATAPSAGRARRIAGDVSAAAVDALRADGERAARRRQRDLRERIDEITARLARLRAAGDPDSASEADELVAARSLLVRSSATALADALASGAPLRLAAPASASPTPVSPRPLRNLGLGLALGLALGLGLAWARERVDRALRSPQEAEAAAGAPVLAAVPLVHDPEGGDPRPGEAYALLRANLEFESRDAPRRVLAVVGPVPGTGTTTVVEGLGRAAAEAGRRTLLVDGDLRAGSLSARLGHADAPGLADVLAGEAGPGAVVVELSPGLSLVPAHAPVTHPATVLDDGQGRSLLTELASAHDTVLVDCPAIALRADGLLLAARAEGVLVVVRTGSTTRDELGAAVEAIGRTGTPIVGLVVLGPAPGPVPGPAGAPDAGRRAAAAPPAAPSVAPALRPQLTRSQERLPRGDDWVFEPTGDGHRVLAVVDGDERRLQGANGRWLEERFPEVVLPAGRYVLDGELVVPGRGGRSDADALRARLRAPRSRVTALAEELPARLLASDLLVRGDDELVGRPFEERRRALEALAAGPGAPVTFALAPIARDRHEAEGWLHDGRTVVARRRSAPYRPGERAGATKVRPERRVDCVVLGWRPGDGDAVDALLLGLFTPGGRLREAGEVAELGPRAQRGLADRLRTCATVHGNGAADGWVRLRPEVVVRVGLGAGQRHVGDAGTRVVGWRADGDPRACRTDQLKG